MIILIYSDRGAGLFFLIDDSFTFFFRRDGLREKPKALRSVTHPCSCLPIMSPSWVSLHELTSMSQLLWFIFKRRIRLTHELPMPNCSRGLWILERLLNPIRFLNLKQMQTEYFFVFLCLNIFFFFAKPCQETFTHCQEYMHCVPFSNDFSQWFVVLFCFCHYFRCCFLFQWQENTNTSSDKERIRLDRTDLYWKGGGGGAIAENGIYKLYALRKFWLPSVAH